MNNSGKNMIFSVGCVMCASNFTFKDDGNVVTACGHLYHKKCIQKWFESEQDLKTSGVKSCPDCRTNINRHTDLKRVYLHYTVPDDVSLEFEELRRERTEHQQLARQLFFCTAELKQMKQQLRAERARNSRLTSQKLALEMKLEAAANVTCSRCESKPSTHGKMKASKKRHKKTTLEAASIGVHKMTRVLRNREYSYTL